MRHKTRDEGPVVLKIADFFLLPIACFYISSALYLPVVS
jgi:hypothetical protein